MVISGYELFMSDREGHTKGGAAMYFKEGIVSNKLETLKGGISSTGLLWVTILGSKSNLVLGMCYCPPDQNTQGDFEIENGIREASKGEGFVMMGDFNYPCAD